MDKVEAQRAMRDARYAAYQASRAPAKAAPAKAAPTKAAPAKPAVARTKAEGAPTEPVAAELDWDAEAPWPVEAAPAADAVAAVPEAAVAQPAAPVEDEPEAGLCGHRNIGNKSCSRPAGHTEKNHRYK